MVEYFKRFINFISFDLSVQAHLLVVIFTVSSVVIFVIELVLCVVCRKKRDTVYYLCYAILCSLIISYFAVEDYLGNKILFVKAKNVYAVITVIVSVSTVFYMILRAVSSVKKPKIVVDKVEKEGEYVAVKSVQTKPYEYYFIDKKTDGYLDVSYLKKLIGELKDKQLSENDYGEIEELELYLMNFISRQPSESERVILSEKLSMLIKKIAYYSN